MVHPKTSPWGAVQSVREFGDGVVAVSTAGHGGFKLDRERNNKIPPMFRKSGGWYEEDCEAAIVMYFVLLLDEQRKASAVRVLKDYFWVDWELFTGKSLSPGESSGKDRHLFEMAHENDFVVRSAMSLRHEPGIVGTCAVREKDGVEAWFRVPGAEYDQRGQFGFVIDESRHVRSETPLF